MTDTYEEAETDFYKTNFDASSWEEISVPGHVQFQGQEAPQYVNSMYPWNGHEDLLSGELPTVYNPV